MNRILYASDCLDILDDEDKLPTGSVGLIYLDPPFNSNSRYNLPFKGKDKSMLPVEAFNDTWYWTEQDDERLQELACHPRTRSLADIVKFAQKIEQKFGGGGGYEPSRVSAEHGDTLVCYAAGAKGYGQYLPPLRPDGEPLSETSDGCYLRTEEFSQ